MVMDEAFRALRGRFAKPSAADSIEQFSAETWGPRWESFVQMCTIANVEQFLAETCEASWLSHVNWFNLDAELEFIERNDLNPMLLAEHFAYALWALESSDQLGLISLVEAYKALFDDFSDRHFTYQAPEKLVHLMSRQAVRDRLSLPPLTQEQIDAFYAQPQHSYRNTPLSSYPRLQSTSDVPHTELLRVSEFLRTNYPDVVDYWIALLTKSESQGYEEHGLRSLGGHTTPLRILDATIAYFYPSDWIAIADLRAGVLDILTDGQIKRSGWLSKN